MGPIPSDCGDPCYFSDVYVSSYTPTLSALIASRERDTQTSAVPMLLVAQHGTSLPGAWPDAEVIYDLDLQATSVSPRNMSSTGVRYFSNVYGFSYALCAHSISGMRYTSLCPVLRYLLLSPAHLRLGLGRTQK
jgi:hypothetical protein